MFRFPSILTKIISSKIIKRGAARWTPDTEWIRQFDGPVMYPDETTSKWKMPPWNGKIPIPEKTFRNVIINFGPAHPAAHGVLRMMVELEGEVVVFDSVVPCEKHSTLRLILF